MTALLIAAAWLAASVALAAAWSALRTREKACTPAEHNRSRGDAAMRADVARRHGGGDR